MTTNVGKYTLVRKLATGGMAEVFLARAQGAMGFQKTVVVKRILPHFSDDPNFIQMFLGEARLAAELNHPNLVQVFDFGQEDGRLFLAMEYIDGPNLRTLNQAVRAEEGPLSFPLVARIIALAAEGLHAAHELTDEFGRPQGLVHRDISPDNILVSKSGAVKVVDFGIAKATNQVSHTRSGVIKGKMAYMPPEQLTREPLDRRCDIFALGIVMHELVAGSLPFDATSEVSIIQAIMGSAPLERASLKRPDVPPGLEAIITRCLEKNRERRYPTCRELQGDLERFLQAQGAVVGTGDIAEVITRLFSHSEDVTMEARIASGEVVLQPTIPRAPSQANAPQAGPVPPDLASTGSSSTALRMVPEAAAAMKAPPLAVPPLPSAPHAVVVVPPPRRSWLVPGLAALVVVAVVGGLVARKLFAPGDPAPVAAVDAGQPAVDAVPHAALLVVDAGPAPAAVVDAGAAEAPPVDAGLAVVEEVDAGPARPLVRVPAAPRLALLELRIRPYATVYVDGKLVGDTPLPALTLPVGKHALRLVNPGLKKDVVLEVVLKPGENVVKHNLKQEE